MALSKIISVLFPPIPLLISNSKITKKIDRLWANIDSRDYYSNAYPKVNENELKSLYDTGIQIKEKLEDKGKSTLFTMTLVTTLFSGFITLTYNNNFLFVNTTIQYLVYFVIGLIMLYMLTSAFVTLRMLSESNKVYVLSVDYYQMNNKDRIDQIGMNIEANNLLNIRRNNVISSSFQCILNAILLIIVFMSVLFINSQMNIKDSSNQSSSQIVQTKSSSTSSAPDINIFIIK